MRETSRGERERILPRIFLSPIFSQGKEETWKTERETGRERKREEAENLRKNDHKQRKKEREERKRKRKKAKKRNRKKAKKRNRKKAIGHKERKRETGWKGEREEKVTVASWRLTTLTRRYAIKKNSLDRRYDVGEEEKNWLQLVLRQRKKEKRERGRTLCPSDFLFSLFLSFFPRHSIARRRSTTPPHVALIRLCHTSFISSHRNRVTQPLSLSLSIVL